MKTLTVSQLKNKPFQEPILKSISEVNAHIKLCHEQFGFTNTSVYLDKKVSGIIIGELQKNGFRVFGEVSPYSDTLVNIEWF